MQNSSKEIPLPYRTGSIRFCVLSLLILAMFGSQYAFNNPQSLETYLIEDLDISPKQYQLLYTIFALPGIPAMFVVGYLIDIMGARIGMISLTSAVAISQLIIAIGGYTYSYTAILIGRMFFGLATQSLIIAQMVFVSTWFKGQQLSFALGIATTFPQIGNALNSYFTPQIYVATNSLGFSLLVSMFISIFSVICAIAASIMDLKADKQDKQNRVIMQDNNPAQSQGPEPEVVNLKDLKQLSLSYWLLIIICMMGAILYVVFLDGANELYIQRFCFNPLSAGKAIVVTYLSAVISTPFFGIIIDKVGFKRYFIMASMMLLALGHIIILAYQQCDSSGKVLTGSIVGLVFLGLGFGVFSNCVFPTIPLVVKKKMEGTAFGIMQVFNNIGLAFFPLINGAIIQASGYRSSSVFFACLGILSILISFGLFCVPDKIKRRLDRNSSHQMQAKVRQDGAVVYSQSQATQQQIVQKQIQITQQSKQILQQKTQDGQYNRLL